MPPTLPRFFTGGTEILSTNQTSKANSRRGLLTGASMLLYSPHFHLQKQASFGSDLPKVTQTACGRAGLGPRTPALGCAACSPSLLVAGKQEGGAQGPPWPEGARGHRGAQMRQLRSAE